MKILSSVCGNSLFPPTGITRNILREHGVNGGSCVHRPTTMTTRATWPPLPYLPDRPTTMTTRGRAFLLLTKRSVLSCCLPRGPRFLAAYQEGHAFLLLTKRAALSCCLPRGLCFLAAYQEGRAFLLLTKRAALSCCLPRGPRFLAANQEGRAFLVLHAHMHHCPLYIHNKTTISRQWLVSLCSRTIP